MYEFVDVEKGKKRKLGIKYVTLPVSKETKKLVDERKKELGAETYDEAIREMARPKGWGRLKELEGILKGAPPFVRDKRDRNFA